MKKVTRGQVRTRNVVMLAQCVKLPHFRLVTYWLHFYQSDLFISISRSEIRGQIGATHVLTHCYEKLELCETVEGEQGARRGIFRFIFIFW